MPSGSPAFVRHSIRIDKHLIIVFAGNPEIQSPIRMMLMGRVTRKTAALEDWSNLPLLTQIPGMIEVILANPGVDSDFQPFDTARRIGSCANLIPAAGHRYQVLPGNTVLKRAAATR
jgi:hypothetical protein